MILLCHNSSSCGLLNFFLLFYNTNNNISNQLHSQLCIYLFICISAVLAPHWYIPDIKEKDKNKENLEKEKNLF